MPRKRLALVLAAVLLATALPSPSASARDLVKATAALVLAEDPPPSRSQILEKKRQEEAVRVAAEPERKVVDDTPYYKKWWFWALTAAVVGGTVALGVWAIEPSRKPAQSCDATAVACFGAGRGEAR